MTVAAQATDICMGTTKAGTRCKRKSLSGKAFCSQHVDQALTVVPGPHAGNGSNVSGAVKSTVTDIPDARVDAATESAAAAMAADTAVAAAAAARASATSAGPVSAQDAFDTPIADDFDRGEFDDVISELTGENSFLNDIAGSVVGEVGHITEMAGHSMHRLRDMAISHGIISPNQWEQFVTDLFVASVSVVSAFTKRMSGEYEEDDYGFDQEFTETLIPAFNLLYEYYWRVDVEGIHNVPDEGAALLVSNHAGGGIPFDGAMTKLAIFREKTNPRHSRMLVLDWLMSLPWVADFAKRTGQALACSENAVDLLRRGELVGVFPEGAKGMAKPFSQRYNLERFGRGGFVRIALQTGAPIIPVAVVGSEETYPKIGSVPFLNKLIGAPFIPITLTFPWLGLLGLLPLPSKWHIEFCDPIDVSQYGPDAADDRALVLQLSEQVRSTIQQRLRANLLKRKTPFW